ncbi:hypothetical protein I2483_13925 [Sporosarcina sp. E16_3]|uniref:helix-turn-helix domain-containing protein n=1 Tax=Sporosarcina sp. E16_3 TaxID=2789293 RepID=UPI001A91CD4E|nr:helix-turn-helix domain-containing protein [Sporosarcina sp. E16_3]MBO0602762.1 hypothetical protein [Sporosarcina sp. E16_3]
MVCQIKSTDRCFFAYLKGITHMTNNLVDTLLNTEETYRNLQPFHTVAELNANTTEIRAQYADQMTPATYDVLDVLHRWACKYPGVCFLGKTKIAAILGITRRTVIRACNALESFGVIVQHETKRKGGDRRQSTNAIVFVKLAPVTPDVTPECHALYTPANSPINTNTLNTNDTEAQVIHKDEYAAKKDENQDAVNPNDKAHLKASLPDGWYKQASGYAQDYADLYGITGALFKGKHGTDLRVEDHVEEFGEVLRKSWVSLKQGKIERSKWYAYLYTAFKRTAVAIQRQQRHAPMQRRIEAVLLGELPF